MLIVSNFDGHYQDYGKALYASIRRNAPYASVYFEMFNVSEQTVKEFESKRRHDRDNFIFQAMRFDSDDERIDYMANRRARLITHLLVRGWQDILWLDADSLVKKDPLSIWWSEFDLATYEPGEIPGARTHYLISTIALRNTAHVRRFAANWCIETDALKVQPDICRVQEAFARVLWSTPESFDFASLDKVFSDYEFNDGSVIWEAHSTRKTNDMRWLNEHKYYLDGFHKIGVSGS